MKCYNFILRGHEVVPEPDPIAWSEWFGTADRTVAHEHVGEVFVSTVFIGVDHGFGLDPAPVVFETMIFGGPLDESHWRYCTWDEAILGHALALHLVRGLEILARPDHAQG